jgi:hypothetical protein
MNFICGDRFVELADFVYTIDNPDDYYKHPNTFDLKDIEAFDGVPIIYTLTGNAKPILAELTNTTKRVILITHSADVPVDKALYNLAPPNVSCWFAQNVACHEDRLHAIPIGIENAQRKEFHHHDKPKRLLAQMAKEKTCKNLVYLNCSAWTNTDERMPLYKHLESKPWVTTIKNPNIFNFDEYIFNIHRHKFVACPSGNGIDTHRTWESLYLDSIPIEKKNFNNAFWADLPICFVNNWEDIDEDFLNAEYARIMSKEWNLDKLEFSFWEQLIRYRAIK